MIFKRYLPVLLLVITSNVSALSVSEARHLLTRTGFSPSFSEIQPYLTMTREEAVDNVLNTLNKNYIQPVPKWVDLNNKNKFMNMRISEIARSREIKIWWYKQMIGTKSPLQERMIMFWHNHFTSSLHKVKSPTLIFNQHQLIRKHATGSFSDLLINISKDPAMLIYLDAQFNKKDELNENFARELLELFTLGEGNYTESDVKNAARAFTGWGLNHKSKEFVVNNKNHDSGEKMFLRARGSYDGNDILRILLNEKRTSEYIVEKLWAEFISDNPDKNKVGALSKIFFNNNYSIKVLLKELFLEEEFWDVANKTLLVKSPVELIVGVIRSLNIEVVEPHVLEFASKYMKQDLFNPPDVRGWVGGESWLYSDSLEFRRDFLNKLITLPEKVKLVRVDKAISPDPYEKKVKISNPKLFLTSISMLNIGKSDADSMFLPMDTKNKNEISNIDESYFYSLITNPMYQLK